MIHALTSEAHISANQPSLSDRVFSLKYQAASQKAFALEFLLLTIHRYLSENQPLEQLADLVGNAHGMDWRIFIDRVTTMEN